VSDDAHIQSLVGQLDAAIPRDGRLVVLPDPDECSDTLVRASKLGYLRLGLELMKAAYVPSRRERSRDVVEPDLGYLTGLEAHCYSFERSEEIERPVPTEPPGTLGTVFAWTIVGLVLVSLLVGAVTILRWLGFLLF
jgi:hypothetical protein